MMLGADLHIHTRVSDGRYSPAEIVRMADAAGLSAIAITDHDTVDGILPALEAAGKFPGLQLIPGLEISTDTSNGKVHVLGYFIDYTNKDLIASLDKMRNSRYLRAEKMVSKLKSLGCNIEMERVKEIAGSGAVGKPHIARALLESGDISSLQEAFDKYIGDGGPAYVTREKLTPVEAVKLVIEFGGLPVLAHPFSCTSPEKEVKELKAAGLVGLETFYAGYLPKDIQILLNIADKYELIPTGGTDYHGIDADSNVNIGEIDLPFHYVEKLIALAEQKSLRTF